MARERIEFIDALRGFAIFMVVFNHIAVHITDTPTVFCDMALRWRMPLFFFISGFLINNLMVDATNIKKRLINRITKQLYPTIIVFVIFILFSVGIDGGKFGDSISDAIMDPMKGGYWFTLSLFEVFVSLVMISFVVNKLNASLKSRMILLSALILLLFGLAYIIEGEKLGHGYVGKMVDMFSVVRTLQLAVYFYIGVICGICRNEFIKLVSNKIFAIASFSVFIICYYADIRICYVISRIAGLMAVISLFSLIHSKAMIRKPMDYLMTIGKLTLPIYLFHYFNVSSMKNK